MLSIMILTVEIREEITTALLSFLPNFDNHSEKSIDRP
jgi:hypothetical protein